MSQPNTLQPYLTPVLGGSFECTYFETKGTNKKAVRKYFNDINQAQAFVDAEKVKDWFNKIENCIFKLQSPQNIKNSRTDAIATIKKYVAVDKNANLSLLDAAKQIKAWYVPLLQTIAYTSSPNTHDNISTTMLLAHLNKNLLPLVANYNELPTN
jgi:hypothetical protein